MAFHLGKCSTLRYLEVSCKNITGELSSLACEPSPRNIDLQWLRNKRICGFGDESVKFHPNISMLDILGVEMGMPVRG